MILLKCNLPDTLQLAQLTPFQGDLKKRTQKDIEDLAESLSNEGMLMPIAIWCHDNINHILDGHGRYQALIYLALKDASILVQEFPVILIEAETEDDARKALLQITSSYGKVNKQGLLKFAAPLVDYKAPIITKAAIVKASTECGQCNDKVIIKLRIHKDRAQELIALLKKVDGLEIF